MPKSKRITANHRKRWEKLREHGCICCKKVGVYGSPEIHHLVVASRRLGHDTSIPLCAWHHRAVPMWGLTSKKAAAKLYGPSLADGKKTFVKEWGTEHELLEEVNKWLEGEDQQKSKGQRQSGSSLPF